METQEQWYFWDQGKALANERKHAIAFGLATDVFRDPLRVIYHDIDHADSEDRWVVVGLTKSGALVVVICAIYEREDHEDVRIISARKATARERREYESGEYSVREPEVTDEFNLKPTSEAATAADDYDDGMKAEYDFSKGIRGALKHWRLPIHIDNEVLGYFHTRSIKLGIDTTEAINEILRAHVGLPPRTEPYKPRSTNEILRRQFGLPPRPVKPPASTDVAKRR